MKIKLKTASGAATFKGDLIKQTGPGVRAVSTDIKDALGNQYILAAPTADALKAMITMRFPEMPIDEKKFVSIAIIILEP